MPSLARLTCAAAIALLLAALPAGTAIGAGPEAGTVVRVEFDLPASNGFQAHLETSEDEDVTLDLWRQQHGISQEVSYVVPGKVSEAGLKVRFAGLGLIDVAFTPTVTLDATEVSPGCTGAPRTLREGVFSGTIDISGERGYVRIEGTEVTGSMSVISQWQCPEEDGLNPFEGIPGVPQLSARPTRADRAPASLLAASRSCRCFFGVTVDPRRDDRRALFFATRSERRGSMKIGRVMAALEPAFSFAYDHEAGTASLDPAPPIKGRATFRSRDRGRDLWRSTIRVPLPGAAPLRTGGPGFGAGLYAEYTAGLFPTID